MAMSITITVYLDKVPCNIVDMYSGFIETSCLQRQLHTRMTERADFSETSVHIYKTTCFHATQESYLNLIIFSVECCFVL